MKSIIPNLNKPINSLEVDEVLAKKTGIIVFVDMNREIHFLSEYSNCNHLNLKAAFCRLNSFEEPIFSSARSDRASVLTSVSMDRLFYFETAIDFANAIIRNNWVLG